MGHLKRGDIFFADLGSKTRPWLVVQNNTGNYFSTRTIVVPLTSKIKNTLPTHCVVCWGSIRPSAVQCEEITHVEVNDDWQAVETLPPEIMRHVDEALKIAIGLE
jgi:mRNA interferase MazF